MALGSSQVCHHYFFIFLQINVTAWIYTKTWCLCKHVSIFFHLLGLSQALSGLGSGTASPLSYWQSSLRLKESATVLLQGWCTPTHRWHLGVVILLVLNAEKLAFPQHIGTFLGYVYARNASVAHLKVSSITVGINTGLIPFIYGTFF